MKLSNIIDVDKPARICKEEVQESRFSICKVSDSRPSSVISRSRVVNLPKSYIWEDSIDWRNVELRMKSENEFVSEQAKWLSNEVQNLLTSEPGLE